MKRTQILTLIITITFLCSGCGKNEPATETDNNAAKQAAEITTKPTETAEPEEISNPLAYYESGDATEDNKLSLNKISAPRWDDMSPDFYIDVMSCYDDYGYCSGYDYNDDDFVYSSDCDYEIPADENMKSICERNKEYLTDKGKYKDNEGNIHDAVYFFTITMLMSYMIPKSAKTSWKKKHPHGFISETE